MNAGVSLGLVAIGYFTTTTIGFAIGLLTEGSAADAAIIAGCAAAFLVVSITGWASLSMGGTY